MKIIQIGTGGWGKNHARILSELGVLVAICDVNIEKSKEYGKKYSVNYYDSLEKILESEEFDGAFVVTPTSTHTEIAKKLLEAKKHVFVEKPMTYKSEEGEKLTKLAEKNKARVFQASTSEVYGDAKVHPQNEEYWGNVNPIGIRACYDEGKRCGETLFFDYYRQHKVDIRVGRIFNTYGPRMNTNDGREVSNFIVQALQNAPITVYGTGSQTRSFCYVDDLVDGILKFTDQDKDLGPVNIGNPNEISMHELADTICKLTASKSQIKFMNLPQDDPVRRNPDVRKMKSLVSWEPQVALEDGLKETIRYFKKVLS